MFCGAYSQEQCDVLIPKELPVNGRPKPAGTPRVHQLVRAKKKHAEWNNYMKLVEFRERAFKARGKAELVAFTQAFSGSGNRLDGKKKGVEPSPWPIKPGDIRRYTCFIQLSARKGSVFEGVGVFFPASAV